MYSPEIRLGRATTCIHRGGRPDAACPPCKGLCEEPESCGKRRSSCRSYACWAHRLSRRPPPCRAGSWCGRDEFSYSGLPNPAKWGYEEGYVRHNELQYYSVNRLESARVEDGNLLIELRKETPENFLPHADQRRMASVYVGQREQLMIF